MEKQNWTVTVGKILFKYRSYFFVPILLGLIIFTKPQMSFDSKIADVFFDVFGFILALLGFYVRVLVIGYKKSGTSGRGTNIDVREVVTDGMYQVCRNPLYLANFLMWLGLTIMWWEIHFSIIIVGFFVAEYFFIIKAEESYLSDKFGKVYDDYKKSVPAFFPRIKNFPRGVHWDKKPDRPFNWDKVLKNETNLLLLILAFPPLFYIYENLRCGLCSSGIAIPLSHSNATATCILLEVIVLIGWIIIRYNLHYRENE
ncbi:MAG: isoprenylcysteine carboxylmethyltransferase family protein [Elusimicrobiota bacterium]